MSHQLSLPFPPDALPRVALGICLGNRRTGVAVVTRDRLLRAYVIGLRRVPRRRRVAHLAAILRQLVARYDPCRIAFAQCAEVATTKLHTRLVVRLSRHPAADGLTLTTFAATDVRVALLGAGARPTNRALAVAIAARFPELETHAPEPLPFDEPTNGPWVARRAYPTPKDRYYARLFLAVAGALHDLEEELTSRLTA